MAYINYGTGKVLNDLAGKVSGEIRFSEHDRILYSTDASMFKIKPTGVIIPASTADVVTVVKYCHKNKIPFTARGTGSGLAGGARTIWAISKDESYPMARTFW